MWCCIYIFGLSVELKCYEKNHINYFILDLELESKYIIIHKTILHKKFTL